MGLKRTGHRRAAKTRAKQHDTLQVGGNAKVRKETLDVAVTVHPDDWWDQHLAGIQRDGLLMAEEYRRSGHHFHLENLSLRQVRGGDKVQLSAAKMELDWKITTKVEIAEAARDIIQKSYTLGSLDPALQTILTAVIEEKGLYEHNIGEFFLLYGRFEQKYGLFDGPKIRAKMEELIQGEEKFLKPCRPYSKQGYGHEEDRQPLPYAVRNILTHPENPTVLDKDGEDLRTSIELLKSWLR